MPEPVAARSPRSIAAALEAAVEPLERAGVRDSRREARTLWAAVAGGTMAPGDVWLHRHRAPAPEVVGRFSEAVARRSSGIPFAYAVGRVGFRTLDLQIDQRALIPRPETEGLVELVLDRTRPVQRGDEVGGVVADIGTGCGCIALSLACEGSFDRVIAVERSPDAAQLARENGELVCPPVPVEVREGDAQQTLVDPGGPVDLVLLDGFKALYIPILKLLRPHLHTGSVVFAGTVDATAVSPSCSFSRDIVKRIKLPQHVEERREVLLALLYRELSSSSSSRCRDVDDLHNLMAPK